MKIDIKSLTEISGDSELLDILANFLDATGLPLQLTEFVFDVMTSYGVNACPPLLVGIGIGGSIEVAANLSKKAIFRPIGSRSSDKKGAEMELLIEKGLNKIGIGPQGLSGNNSVMGVHIEKAARHPSTISVAVSVGCWAHRRGTIHINEDMSYEILSHKGVTL